MNTIINQMVSNQNFIDIVMAVITLFATIAAWISAAQAKNAAQETRSNTKAQILVHMMDRYTSTEMLKAIIEVRKWLKQYNTEAGIELDRQLSQDPIPDKAFIVNNARRTISSYFQNVYMLNQSKNLDLDDARILIDRVQAQLYLDVKPLERVKETFKEDSYKSYSWVAGLYEEERS